MKKAKRIIAITLSTSLILSSNLLIPSKASALRGIDVSKKQILVLVETSKDHWSGIQNAASPIASVNKPLVSLSKLKKKLGYKIKTTKKTVIVSNTSKKKLTYTKDSKSYKYNKSKKNASIKTQYKGINGSAKTWLVDYKSLSYAYNIKYSTKSLSSLGYKNYSGVLCISKFGKISSLPNSKKISNTSVTTTGSGVNILGVNFAKQSKFRSDLLKTKTWANFNSFYDLGFKLIPYCPCGGDTTILPDDYLIGFSGAGTAIYDIELSKNLDKGYFELTISSNINAKKPGKLDTAKMDFILASITSIVDSKSVDTVYNTIIKDAAIDACISTKSFTTVGNTKIKCVIGDGKITYLIKAK